MEGFVSVSEAARIKKVTRQAIYLAIRLKRLKAYRYNERWKISMVDLRAYDAVRYSRLYHSTYKGEPIFNEEKGFFSVDKASMMLDVPKQKLYYAIRTGMLKATRKRAAWVLHISDLLEYQKNYLKKNCTVKVG